MAKWKCSFCGKEHENHGKFLRVCDCEIAVARREARHQTKIEARQEVKNKKVHTWNPTHPHQLGWESEVEQ